MKEKAMKVVDVYKRQEYIEANGDINIVLKGKNKITISAESTEGIKSTGKVTIDDTISPVQDCLDIYCNDGTESVSMIYTCLLYTSRCV